jgi:hypothetical protein
MTSRHGLSRIEKLSDLQKRGENMVVQSIIRNYGSIDPGDFYSDVFCINDYVYYQIIIMGAYESPKNYYYSRLYEMYEK